jgi:hypothetical protein
MKIRLTLLIIVVLISMLAVPGCATPATQPPATQAPPAPPSATPPPAAPPLATQAPPAQLTAGGGASPAAEPNSEIVLNMVERLNAGDVDGSLAYFAGDAMGYLMGFPPTGIEVYAGKEQLRTLWEDSVSNHFKWEVAITSANGNQVYVQAKTWHDFTRDLGVAPLEYADVYEIKDGAIATYGSWLTEDSLARFKPAFAAVMPPEPTAAPPSGTPVSEITVTIAAGTCTTDDPVALKAGDVKVNWDVQDRDNSLYALTLFNLDPSKDILDLMASTYGSPPSWLEILLIEELGPGESATYPLTLEKGPVYLICWSQPPDLPIGNAGPFAVVP